MGQSYTTANKQMSSGGQVYEIYCLSIQSHHTLCLKEIAVDLSHWISTTQPSFHKKACCSQEMENIYLGKTMSS